MTSLGALAPTLPRPAACMAPLAFTVGANRRIRYPWFALQVDGFRRGPVEFEGVHKTI